MKQLNDSFTGADGTTLPSHVGEFGATWTGFASFPGSPVPSINGNAIVANDPAAYYASSGAAATDGESVSIVIINNSSPSGQNIGCLLRCVPASDTCYQARWDSAGTLAIYRLAGSGSYVSLASLAIGIPTGSTVMKFVATGTGTSVALEIFVGGVSKVTYSDTAANRLVTPGRYGIYVAGASTTLKIDAVQGYDSSVAPTALYVPDRIKDTTTTTGTGAITVSGTPPSRFKAFSTIPVGAKNVPIVIEGQSGTDYEFSECTMTSATTFTRDTVLASSNAGALVNFAAGTKDVYVSASARHVGAATYYLTRMGAISDADLSMGSTTFGTDNTAVIQGVLDLASATRPIKVIFDGKFSTTGLRVRGYTTIECLPGCGAILRSQSNYALLENYNLSFDPNVRTDKYIKITGGIWNGNNANNGKGDGTVGLVCCMRFYGVEDLKLADIVATNQPSYAIHGMNCIRYTAERIKTDCGAAGIINMDGIHADGNCSDVVFRDIIAVSHDDSIAFNADDVWRATTGFTYPYYPAIASGPISAVTVENLRLNTSQAYGIRMLSGASRVDNVNIKNVKGSTQGYAIIADNYWQNPSAITNTGSGNFGTITIDDVEVAITAVVSGSNTCVINVNANVDKMIIRRIRRNDFTLLMPTILISGSGTVIKTLIIEGYESYDSASTMATPHIQIDAATVTLLKISGANVIRTGASNATNLVKLTTTATVTTLQLDNVFCQGIDNVLNNASGTISRIIASNIVHLAPSTGAATFLTASTIARITLSAYMGNTQLSGTFTTQTGDGFATGAAGGA